MDTRTRKELELFGSVLIGLPVALLTRNVDLAFVVIVMLMFLVTLFGPLTKRIIDAIRKT